MDAYAVGVVMPPEGLYLRSGPGTIFEARDLARGGERVGLTGPITDAGWYPAVYKGKRGWMRGEFLEVSGEATAITRRAAVRVTDGAALLDEPRADATRLASIGVGAAVTVSVRTTTDGWVLVAHMGLTGWMATDHLIVEGTMAPPPPAPASAPPLVPSGATPLSSPVVPGTAVRATITYYHPSLEGGAMACGGRYRAEDPTIAAATSWPCGTKLRVCRNGACVVVTVQDTGLMGPNWVDLSASAFRQLAPLPDALVVGTVEVLP